jgi:hypothetical protein
VAAELHGHVAAVRDQDEEKPRVVPPVDAQSTQREVAHDVSGHDHPDADPEAQLHVDAATAQWASRQKDEDTMVARFRASGWPCAERQARALAGAQRQARRPDLEPRLRRRLSADRAPLDVDDDPFSTIVPQLEHSRARRGE